MQKVFRFIITIALILLLASWLIPAAYGQTNGDTEESDIIVEVAPPETAPVVSFFGNAIGGVTAGDLFYVNATNYQPDLSVDLYITNSDELVHYLRYLILKVVIYVEETDGQWTQITLQDGTVLPDTYITMQNSPVNFILSGLARYKVTIESGSYYCYPLRSDSGDISPQFYLTVDSIL